MRHLALNWFQLDQGCIYCKAKQHRDTLLQPRYVVLDNNALEIIKKEHRAL
jgi:DNA repair photolyase